MRKIHLLFLVITLCLPLSANASRFEDIVPNVGYDELESVTGYSTFSELVEAIINGESKDAKNLFEKILIFFTAELKSCIKYVSIIIGFAMLGACIKGVDIKITKNSAGILFLITYSIIAVFLLGILKNCISIASELSEEIDTFVKMTIPAYIGFVSAIMSITNASSMEGLFLVMINVVSAFAGKVMINVLFYTGVLYIINYMSTEIHVLKLIELVRQIMFWLLGFLLTVFAGMTGLSGINAVGASASGMRALKYTVGHAVPVVGGFLADSSDLIFASAKIFKNAFGTAGIIIVFAICLTPVLKLFAMGVMLKASAGLTEPFCDKRISDCIAAIGQTIIYIMVCVILICVMFILSFAVILLVGMGG